MDLVRLADTNVSPQLPLEAGTHSCFVIYHVKKVNYQSKDFVYNVLSWAKGLA